MRPQTEYATCKQLVERDVAKMAGDDFSPTFLRNATAYGASPRMRFDIVLNNLCGHAWTNNEIRMESDGTPWRPLVHLLDICAAVSSVLAAPRERVHGQILNVGASGANYQIREVAAIVGRSLPGLRGHRRRSGRGHTQLSRLVRKNARGAPGLPRSTGNRRRGRGSCWRSSRASVSRARTFSRGGSRG